MSSRKSGSRRPPHRSATRGAPPRRQHEPDVSPALRELVQEIRTAVRGEPLSLAILVSGILEAFDPTTTMPDLGEGPTLVGLVDSLIAAPVAETTATLHVIATLTEDDLIAARIRRELADRHHPMPLDVAELGRLTVGRAVRMVVSRDEGEDLLLELTGPGIRDVTFITYVDHRYGSLIKDAFPAPGSLDALIEELRDLALRDGHPADFQPVSLADARAMLEGALAAYANLDHGLPPDDMWPMVRPLLRFVLASLPEGGTGYPAGDPATFRTYAQEAQEAEEEMAELEEPAGEVAHDFLDSAPAAALTADPDLIHDVAHTLALYGLANLGDALIWAVEDVEHLMTRALPVILPDDAAVFRAAPAMIEAFIRFCHEDDDAVEPHQTRATLQAVTQFTVPFLALRTDPEVARQRAEIAALDASASLGLPAPGEMMRRFAIEMIGPLDDLTLEPLPDEDLDLTGIPESVVGRVRRVAELVEDAVQALYADGPAFVEVRTAARRLVALAAAADPRLFGGRAKDASTAAALVWIIGKANEVLGVPGEPSIQTLMRVLDVRTNPGTRAHLVLDAIGGHTTAWGGVSLGRLDLLISQRRIWVHDWLA